jgi:hypothetical protein
LGTARLFAVTAATMALPSLTFHLMTMVDFYQADAMEHLDMDFFGAYPGGAASCANAKQHAHVKSYEASVAKS